MIAREWKPGDVAVSLGDRLIRTHEGTWSSALGQSGIRYTAEPPRPLVVIDPEDDEQIEIREDYSAEAMGMPTRDPFMYAVADWLDVAADHFDPGGQFIPVYAEALAAARAYLGEA